VQAAAGGGVPVAPALAADDRGALKLSARRVPSDEGSAPLTMVLIERPAQGAAA
jgi:hypothetical protein